MTSFGAAPHQKHYCPKEADLNTSNIVPVMESLVLFVAILFAF
jgi:hypothetical protein